MQKGSKKHSSLKIPSTLTEVSRGWGAVYLSLGGEGGELGFIFVVFVSPLSTPPTQSYFTPHYVIKIYYQTTQKLVTLNLGEAQFFCTLLTNSPGITRYTEKHK